MSTDTNQVELAIPEEWLEESWNKQADQFNQWIWLSLGEQLEWAQAQAVEADRARTALAEPVGEGLTDEEILNLMPQQFRDDMATVSRLASYGTPVDQGIYQVSHNTGALSFARAVLARWGRPVALDAEPVEDGNWYAVAIAAQDMRSRKQAEQMAGEELLKMAKGNRSQPAWLAALPQQQAAPAPQAVMDAYRADWREEPLRQDCKCLAAALRAAAGQMIKTDDLTDTIEDVIRGSERHHQAGWLHTIATELEGPNA